MADTMKRILEKGVSGITRFGWQNGIRITMGMQGNTPWSNSDKSSLGDRRKSLRLPFAFLSSQFLDSLLISPIYLTWHENSMILTIFE